MSEIHFLTSTNFSFEKVFELYEQVGWTVYTSDKIVLEQALKNSTCIITAWKEENLVGLLRAVGDGFTIMYVQDILVLPNFRRKNIGRQLLNQLLDKYFSVRQIVLMTDNKSELIAFYENCGFTKTNQLHLQTFVQIRNSINS